MKVPNRDLLVLVKDEFRNQQSMENELEQLNKLLISYETMDSFCIAHEVFDLNKFKIIRSASMLRKVGRKKELNPFIFIYNKN